MVPSLYERMVRRKVPLAEILVWPYAQEQEW